MQEKPIGKSSIKETFSSTSRSLNIQFEDEFLLLTNYYVKLHIRKRCLDAIQKTAEAKAFVEEQVAERERVRIAKEKMKLQIEKAIKIQVGQ